MTRTITLIILALSGYGYAQQNSLKNAIYAELGGTAVYYSVNYERIFTDGFFGRVGFGAMPPHLTFPVMGGKYFLKGSHHPEITVGLLYVASKGRDDIETEDSKQLFATFGIGYRYQKPGAKFLFRAGYTPLYKLADSYSEFNNRFWTNWAGMSFGFRF
jgi:hypothetical protein